jgi:hypothetical protein
VRKTKRAAAGSAARLETFRWPCFGELRFLDVPGSRNRSVNHSPLGAASRSFTASLSFFYECVRRKSRRNSRTRKSQRDALEENIFSPNFGAQMFFDSRGNEEGTRAARKNLGR